MRPHMCRLVQLLGSPAFTTEIAAVGSELLEHDHISCHLFEFDGSGTPKFHEPLFVQSYDGGTAIEIAGRNYLTRWWRDDPDLKMIARTSRENAWISVLATKDVWSVGYVNFCARLANVQERVAITVRSGNYFASLRLYRSNGRRFVIPSDLSPIRESGELLGSLCLKQSELLETGNSNHLKIHVAQLVRRARQLGTSLSCREEEVLSGILSGKTIIEIAASMCIAPTSAATFRRRAYEKLGIAKKTELFRMCLAKML